MSDDYQYPFKFTAFFMFDFLSKIRDQDIMYRLSKDIYAARLNILFSR